MLKRLFVLLISLSLFSCMPVSTEPHDSPSPIVIQDADFTVGSPILVRIFKEEKMLEVWMLKGDQYARYKAFPICFHSGELGPKLREGDRQSPEGFYQVFPASLNPNSRYHLSFNLGYPNAYDRSHGRTGGYLMVHGGCVSRGCYAMTDERIEEIYALADAALQNGQPFFQVHSFPFRMTEDNMRRHQDSPWYGFWQNLKEGYDLFESYKQPPIVSVQDKQYAFSAPIMPAPAPAIAWSPAPQKEVRSNASN